MKNSHKSIDKNSYGNTPVGFFFYTIFVRPMHENVSLAQLIRIALELKIDENVIPSIVKNKRQ